MTTTKFITTSMCVAASDAAQALGIIMPASHAGTILEAALSRRSAPSSAAPAPAAGWRMVPEEPTPEMREAFHAANEAIEEGRDVANLTGSPDWQWAAMLRAAHPAPCAAPPAPVAVQPARTPEKIAQDMAQRMRDQFGFDMRREGTQRWLAACVTEIREECRVPGAVQPSDDRQTEAIAEMVSLASDALIDDDGRHDALLAIEKVGRKALAHSLPYRVPLGVRTALKAALPFLEYNAGRRAADRETVNCATAEAAADLVSGILALVDAAPAMSVGYIPLPQGLHPDTAKLVCAFAEAVAAKLRLSEVKYGWTANWTRKDWRDELVSELLRHVHKGDPRDVAAYCAFAWHHGWDVAPAAQAQPSLDVTAGHWTASVTDNWPDKRLLPNAWARVMEVRGTFATEAEALAAAEGAIASGWVSDNRLHRETAKVHADFHLPQEEINRIGRGAARAVPAPVADEVVEALRIAYDRLDTIAAEDGRIGAIADLVRAYAAIRSQAQGEGEQP